jgi:hypothetical protein
MAEMFGTTTSATSSSAPAKGPVTDVTLAPAKILSVTELKNGHVYVVTEGKVYQLDNGKLRPLIFADVEAAVVLANATPAAVGAVPAAPPPPPPPNPPVAPAPTVQ